MVEPGDPDPVSLTGFDCLQYHGVLGSGLVSCAPQGVTRTPGVRRPIGLAAQILRVTLIIGVVTIVSAGSIALISTFRMTSGQIATRDAAALHSIEDALRSRYVDAQQMAASVARAAAAASDPASLQATLTPIYERRSSAIAGVWVLDRGPAPIVALPASRTVLPSAALSSARLARRGTQALVRTSETTGFGSLWLSQPVVTRSGEPLVVLVEVDMSFLSELLALDTREWRSTYVLERGSVLTSTNPVPVDLRTAREAQPDALSGRLDARSESGARYFGYYNDIQGLPGLDWRLVTLEPVSSVSREMLLALWPSIAVLVVGGLIALFGAWQMAQRVVAPLRQLQSAALKAASGSYVKPIEPNRHDELGQVATAFNAVALRLNALHDMSQLLASSSQLDQVLDGILSAMGHIVGPGVVAIYLLDEGGKWLVPVRARGADITLAPAIDATGDAWLARALGRGRPSLFERGGRELAEELPGLVTTETAALAAPLAAGNTVHGVIVMLTRFGSQASEAEFEMVRTFSAQAALAVQNSRLFAVESESRRVAEALQSVAERLVRPGGLAQALAEVEVSVSQLFSGAYVRFAVTDRALLGLPPADDVGAESDLLGMALRVLESADVRSPVVVRPGDDSAADAIMQQVGAKELLVAPIALASNHGAVLVIGLKVEHVMRRDLHLADAIANQVELSLDNAYFYQQALTRAMSLETIFRISQAVGSSLEVKVVLNRVLDVVQKILSADGVALMTYDVRKRSISTEMARGDVSSAMLERVFRPGDDIVGYVFTSGDPVALLDLHEEMEGIGGDAARHGLKSLLAVPMLARGRSIGVLTVFSAVEGAFSDEDMSTLQTFASQASLALDTARLYSREHEVATVLQRSIQPGALPEFEGIEAASAYEPAEIDAEIGGDYYDLFQGPDGTVWMAIGDVCGKGVVAATKTSMIKFSVRSLVAAGFGPGRVVTELNRMLAETEDSGDIVTLWLGKIDRDSLVLTWASGGHPPGFLRRANTRTVVALSANGPLLGAIGTVTYGDDSIDLGAGDTILLYTDGVTEARSGNTFFGEPRVEAALMLGESAAEVVEELRTSVRRFTQSALRDDVAILVVRLTRDGEDASRSL